jgi:hypothetical protein
MKRAPGNALLSRKETQRKDTNNRLKSQYPAETQFLKNGTTYRPIKISLELLQLLASTIKEGASHE